MGRLFEKPVYDPGAPQASTDSGASDWNANHHSNAYIQPDGHGDTPIQPNCNDYAQRDAHDERHTTQPYGYPPGNSYLWEPLPYPQAIPIDSTHDE